MPLYWVAAELAGEAEPLTQQAQQNIAAALAAAGWVISAGLAWWYGSGEPKASVECSYSFDPAPTWQCSVHPHGDCYGSSWGCIGS
jgi:hypothetical protein